MRLFALAIAMSLAALTTASAETATPDSQNGRYSLDPLADGVLRLDLAPAKCRSAAGAEPVGPASWFPMNALRWRSRSPAYRTRTRG